MSRKRGSGHLRRERSRRVEQVEKPGEDEVIVLWWSAESEEDCPVCAIGGLHRHEAESDD